MGPAQPQTCLGSAGALCDTLSSSHSSSQAGPSTAGRGPIIPASAPSPVLPHLPESLCCPPCWDCPPLKGWPRGAEEEPRGGGEGSDPCAPCMQNHICESPGTPSCPTCSPKGSLDQSRAVDNEQAHTPPRRHGEGWGAGDPPVGLGGVLGEPSLSLLPAGGQEPLRAVGTQEPAAAQPGTRHLPETWPQCHGDGLAAHLRCHGVSACRLRVPLRGWQEAGDSQAPCPPPACPPACPESLPWNAARGEGGRDQVS